MHTALIKCDGCGKEEANPKGWFYVKSGKIYGAESLQIQRLNPNYVSNTRLAQREFCSAHCLKECVAEFANGAGTKKAAKAK